MIERKFFSSSAILNFISESFDTNDDSAKVCFNVSKKCLFVSRGFPWFPPLPAERVSICKFPGIMLFFVFFICQNSVSKNQV
jgi:hypothetical protein